MAGSPSAAQNPGALDFPAVLLSAKNEKVGGGGGTFIVQAKVNLRAVGCSFTSGRLLPLQNTHT